MDFPGQGQSGIEAVGELGNNSVCFLLHGSRSWTIRVTTKVLFIIRFNWQEIDLGLSLRSAINWLCDSEQVTFFLLNRMKAEG